jgi:purine-binding chemotaxis protein CheW
LLARIATQLCALPLELVEEIMRPLPVRTVAGVPDFVAGVTIVRGHAVPVVDGARLLGLSSGDAARLLTLKAASRRVALAVDEVIGVRAIARDARRELPPLLGRVRADVVSSIGTLDGELMLVLGAVRVVPEALWAEIDMEEARLER